ncbi:MAG: methylenetetrahydrofolate reductase [Thermodesulfobacteriota bacterium]
MKTSSNLEKVLEAGYFAVTAEIGPPRNADPDAVRAKAKLIKGFVDAFNVPDGQAALVMMASWAACLIGKGEGLDPVAQMTCRDRNRIALEMDILGVSALGVNNILCLGGDPISYGNRPEAKPVSDLDSIQLVRTVKMLRDDKKFGNGEMMIGREPRLFIGAAANPFSEPMESELARLKEKVIAGADFIQTQPVFNMEKLSRWMQLVREKGLHKQVKILAGVIPLTSAAAARFMKVKVPNTDIPDETIDRLMRVARREEAVEEGIRMAAETIGRLKEMEGIAGVHIMTLQREEIIPRICSEAGLYPRPST